jgi:2-hydroxycyclohexanecarboxyl-CoA dehydrogenase
MGSEVKAAIVTGAGRGIGRAIALKLAQNSYRRVAVFDILGDNADAVKREIEALGGEAIAVQVDLTKCHQVQQGVQDVMAQFGNIDLLVNNAGWDKLEPFLESEESTWEKIISINFKSILYMCRTVLPHMVSHGSGKLISIASDAGRVGSMGEAVYSGTKGAIIAFSKSLTREVARHKITVNVVCPGLTETPLLQGIRDQSEKAHKVIDAVTRAIPLGRVGTPEEIANAVAFFASSEADFVTGQTLSISGGLTMC